MSAGELPDPPEAEVERLQGIIERERTATSDLIDQVRAEIRSRRGTSQSRGSYAWDDDEYMLEFGRALDAIESTLDKAIQTTGAHDWTDCPTSREAITAARSGRAVTGQGPASAKPIAIGETRLTQDELDKLPEYSCSVPGGTTIGKRWRCQRPWRPGGAWFIGEYVEGGEPGYVNIRWTRAIVAAASGLIPNPRRSVLQDWVMELPLREQGTLLTCVRGCDLTPKFPLDSTARRLVGALRCAFLTPADPREVDAEPGCFFVSQPPTDWKASELGHYPQHWLSHVMHSAEVLGYRHPNPAARATWNGIYTKIARSLHLNPETFEQFEARLSEDRFVTGEIVS